MSKLIGVPHHDGEKQYLLVDDEVANEGSVQNSLRISDATTRAANIYVNEFQINRLRQEFPGLPVYGFWHTLIHSGIVDPSGEHDAYIYYDSDAQESGTLLEIREGYIHESVPLMGGIPAGIPCLRPRIITEDDLRHVRLPGDPIMLPSERAAQRMAQVRRLAIVGGSVAAVMTLLGIGVDQYLAMVSQRHLDEAQRISSEARVVQEEVNALRMERDPLTADDREKAHAALTYLAEIADRAVGPKGTVLRPASSPVAVLEVKALPFNLSFPVVATATPASTPTITFSLDGVTDVTGGAYTP